MVLYFSTTGNTEYIAKQIAARLNDQTVDLLPLIREHDYSDIHSDAPFVICAPVYVCEMPGFVAEYLKKARLTGCREVYFVFTSGGYAGISGPLAYRTVRPEPSNTAISRRARRDTDSKIISMPHRSQSNRRRISRAPDQKNAAVKRKRSTLK